jgi:translation initiation factor 2 alpha subunit (eIF-2alpha)
LEMFKISEILFGDVRNVRDDVRNVQDDVRKDVKSQKW